MSFDTIEGQNRKSLTKTKIQFSAGEKKGEKQTTNRETEKKEGEHIEHSNTFEHACLQCRMKNKRTVKKNQVPF